MEKTETATETKQSRGLIGLLKGIQRDVATLEAERDRLRAIVQSLAEWEEDPDRYSGDLADLAHKARAALATLTD